jgi:hypothetical protein
VDYYKNETIIRFMKIEITLEEEYEQASLVTLAIDAY